MQDANIPSGMRPVQYNRSFPGGASARSGGYMPQGQMAGGAPAGMVPAAADPYARSAYAAPQKKKHSKGLIALVIVLVLTLILGGTAFAGVMYMNSVSAKLHEGIDDELMAALSSEEVPAGEPFYALIMGTDESAERAASEEFAGDTFRSDSMILARIDPQNKTVALISIERDTYVNIAGYGPNKLNASASFGGAPLVVSTISEFAGVPISHYVQVNFDGFKAAVDGLGGIDVDVPMTIDDEMAGGRVEAGQQTLNGDQALILCRSRHAYDEYGSGDYYRMANQRMVMGAIAKKLLASDPVTMANTINAMADYITTDMDIASIVSVATSMRGMDVENSMWSAMNPTIPTYENDIWYEYCDLAAWKKMMARVDAGLPPYEDSDRNANTGGTLDGTVTGNQEVSSGAGGSAGSSGYDESSYTDYSSSSDYSDYSDYSNDSGYYDESYSDSGYGDYSDYTDNTDYSGDSY